MADGFTIKEYIKHMDESHSKRLDEILEQVKKTNGRVRELEKCRAYLTGAVALAVTLGIPNLIEIVTKL